MAHEGFLEKERRSKEELSEAEKKKIFAERFAFEKKKQKIAESREKKEKLTSLKSEILRGNMRNSLPEEAKQQDVVQDFSGEIQKIFEQIEMVEHIKNIDEILPKNLRVSSEEYRAALRDLQSAEKTLQKIDHALHHLFSMSGWGSISSAVASLFGFFQMAQKNIATVQEHQIDMKRSLSSLL